MAHTSSATGQLLCPVSWRLCIHGAVTVLGPLQGKCLKEALPGTPSTLQSPFPIAHGQCTLWSLCESACGYRNDT